MDSYKWSEYSESAVRVEREVRPWGEGVGSGEQGREEWTPDSRAQDQWEGGAVTAWQAATGLWVAQVKEFLLALRNKVVHFYEVYAKFMWNSFVSNESLEVAVAMFLFFPLTLSNSTDSIIMYSRKLMLIGS